jgi:glycosyltransferase involved in cell wall biosynthesis
MRILNVIPSVGLVRGGPSQAVLELVRAIHPLGVHAEILCTDDDGPGLLDVPLGTLEAYQGVPVRFFPRFSPPLRPLREFAYSAPLARWLRRHVGDYDLLHIHALFSFAPSAAMRIARRAKVPYIARPCGVLCRWSLRQSRLRKQVFLALWDRANLNGSAAIEYAAEQEREEAADLSLRAPGFVMPYGLHVPELIADARQQVRARLGLSTEEPVVLFLSRLHPKKGVQHLIPAVARLLAQRRFTVLVAGTGEAAYEAGLRHLAAQHSAAERIRFLGFASGEWKQTLLQGADLFVLPSYSESFAIAVMEALAAGTPVVTTPGVPLALLVRKFNLGWICEAETSPLAEALAAGLDSLVDAPTARERRERARGLIARHFAWPTIAARVSQVYEAVLHHRPLPSCELDSLTF